MVRRFPTPAWTVGYRRGWLRGDILAGVTITAYLIPQVMAYAEVAGLPAVAGLWASVGALLAYAVLGSSRQLSVGPESTTALMTAAAIGAVATTGTSQYAEPRRRAVPRGGGLLPAGAGSGGSRSWPSCSPARCSSATWPGRADHDRLPARQADRDRRRRPTGSCTRWYVVRHLGTVHVPTLRAGARHPGRDAGGQLPGAAGPDGADRHGRRRGRGRPCWTWASAGSRSSARSRPGSRSRRCRTVTFDDVVSLCPGGPGRRVRRATPTTS